MTSQIIMMAGGTGGHLFPALAVAKMLRDKGVTVSWLGSAGGMESRLIPENGFAIDYLTIKGLRGNGVKGWLLLPFTLLRAISQAFTILRRRQPQLVIGMGGFASGPGGIAARLLGLPLVIHEQNAIAGMTNRWLASVATEIFAAFPNTFATALAAKVKCVGNPLRDDFIAIAPPEQRLQDRTTPLRILLVGGSLGAQALNQTLPAALAIITAASENNNVP
ncbi:MAG: UDP-N-acetylglucosamine--N-acetylmuramyl-(pentapeptide) pyrophosphoryl-undecaprenol N-acetylglucosamine transferase, partial [Gammaproteobacteria bacterium]|nr:UDP-N-acetylglucosamine--N-acetylmuramyl-(pentapeptide) pyrophosphoryl-undecaprenol N-acetylglucosamine transferase [Gammaproteobacteria bacterium]